MKKFVKAVLITTILSVITRAIGLFIKVYISRIIGAEALGYYQIALSVFFLLSTLVTSGIPLVISRRIASNPESKSKIVFAGLVVSTLIAFVVCGLFLLFPSFITKIWGQNQSLTVLYTLLPAVIFTALYVPFRGAFWGNKNFFLLGFTELIEQIFRFISLALMFTLCLSLGGAEIAGVTYSIACATSSVVAIIIYFIKGGKVKANLNLIKPIISESAPIALMRIGSSVVSLAISVLLPNFLVKTGLSMNEAVSSFGVVTGMVMPLISIPGTLIGSISVALIPEISGTSDKFITRQVNLAISYSIIISFLLLPAFAVLGNQIGILLFNDPLAGKLLSLGSILLLPMGLSQISSSILNAIGMEKLGLINYLVGAGLMLLSITFLPQFFGIYALVYGFLLMSVATALLNLICINKFLNASSLKALFSSTLFALPSGLIGHWAYSILTRFTADLLSVSIAVGLSIVVMIIFYQIFHFINVQDYLPSKLKSHA